MFQLKILLTWSQYFKTILTKLSLKTRKEVAAGSEMSLKALNPIITKSSFTFLAISLNEEYDLTLHEKNYHCHEQFNSAVVFVLTFPDSVENFESKMSKLFNHY